MNGLPDFTIERHRYGVILRGAPLLNDVAPLFKQWGKEGLDTLATCLAPPLGACMVATRWEDLPKWTAEIDADAKTRFPDDPEGEWLHGGHVGTSSLTLFALLCSPQWKGPALSRLGRGESVPHDLDDFTRCRRVIEDVRHEWRGRLVEVAAQRPEWLPFVERWDTLSAIARAADSLPWSSKMKRQAGWRELSMRYSEAKP
jgi:hypothetical protein